VLDDVMQGTAALATQFIRFAGIGAVGTAAHYVSYAVLVRWRVLDAVLASATGFVAGAVVNYSLGFSIVFRSARQHREAVWRFMTIALIGLAVNSMVVGIATRSLGLHYLLAQVSATGVVLCWTFTGNRCWTFVEKL
jgi:putative flippase GtrA